MVGMMLHIKSRGITLPLLDPSVQDGAKQPTVQLQVTTVIPAWSEMEVIEETQEALEGRPWLMEIMPIKRSALVGLWYNQEEKRCLSAC